MDDVAPAPATAGASAGAVRREYFAFGGSGSEYFRIWIVNLLLTVLTLGIYSAWAKVRRNRYIYGSVALLGGRFDYHARPVAILRGRLIAVGLLVVYLLAQSVLPLLAPFLGAVLMLAIPWLIVRSRMFNMRYTSYRNIRFGFEPAYGQSYRVIFWYGLLTVVTFGLAAPYAHYQRNRFVVGNTRFGTLPFALSAGSGPFFFAYFLAFVAGGVIIVPLLGYVAVVLGALQGDAGAGQSGVLSLLPLVFGFAGYYVIGRFLSAATLRATVDASSVGGERVDGAHELGCDWSLNRLLFIYVSNFFVMVLSLGLLTPWAQMRELRYLVDNLWIDVHGDLEDVVARQAAEVSSLGEEIGDVFDVDIGL